MKYEGKFEVVASLYGALHIAHMASLYGALHIAHMASFHGALHIAHMAPCTLPTWRPALCENRAYPLRPRACPVRASRISHTQTFIDHHQSPNISVSSVCSVRASRISSYSAPVSITNDAPRIATRCVSVPVCGSSSYNPSSSGCSRQ